MSSRVFRLISNPVTKCTDVYSLQTVNKDYLVGITSFGCGITWRKSV